MLVPCKKAAAVVVGIVVAAFSAGASGAVPAVDAAELPPPATRPIDFVKDVQPVLARSCYACHGEQKHKGGLRLDVKADALKGGDGGPAFVPGKGGDSLLVRLVAGLDEDRVMPAKGPRLTAEQVGVLRAWIDQGANWPDSAARVVVDKADHWAYKPLTRPAVPDPAATPWAARVRNPIDTFVFGKLAEKGLAPSPEADRRTLIRRVSYDLTGLPPTPAEVEAFVADPDPRAFENLVDRLLASPRYGECWARHWLDVVHYGDTHGYDKDKPRPNAWPYRDYVIRSFNDDKPYARFVKEQLAGDWFYPGTADGVVALGFIAAGPFDFVGQTEVRDGTVDKAITRNLDRDDMVTTAMGTFVSMTAQCARCHDHKFDPISQADYYGLQAVFAGVDRADRPYEPDPKLAAEREALRRKLAAAHARRAEIEKAAVAELAAIDTQLAALAKPAPGGRERPEFGYHSAIAAKPDTTQWVQIDLGRPTAVDRVVLVGAHDTFAGIGAGFGFPARFRIEASDDPAFTAGVTTIADHTAADVPNPGVKPQEFAANGTTARYVRLTATKLAPRQNDYILAVGEMSVLTPDGTNAAAGKPVTAHDSIEAPPRWGRKNLVDGYYYGVDGTDRDAERAKLTGRRRAVLDAALDDAGRRELRDLERSTADGSARLAALPAAGTVFAAATEFAPIGSLAPTHGKPRPVHLLRRGSEKDPGPEAGPGAVGCVAGLPSRFDLPPDAPEAARRAKLAEWITDDRNPMAWRSIVNRVWQYHFGRGIVDTPNDFGHMGGTPTHPELLDWLAAEFRDGGPGGDGTQSLKRLHRLILTSSTYRQSSAGNPDFAKVDGGNQYLWRANRQRLDAEAVHDAVLAVAGKLDLATGGPGYKPFGFEDDHSPRYKYHEADPDDPRTHRRAVYRFVVRSVPDPFMSALDCADPSQAVPRRDETLTPLQALALLNDRFMVRMAEHFAARVEKAAPDLPGRVDAAYRLAVGRRPTAEEREVLVEVARKQGLAGACRVIFNMNEFVFVD